MACSHFTLSTFIPETKNLSHNQRLLQPSSRGNSKALPQCSVVVKGNETTATTSKQSKFDAKQVPQFNIIEGLKSCGLEKSSRDCESIAFNTASEWAFSEFSKTNFPSLRIHGEDINSVNSETDEDDFTLISAPPRSVTNIDILQSNCLYPYDLIRASGSVAGLQTPPPPKQKQESEHKDDYYVNIGYAIRSLREELPSLFYKELSYDIYRDDITFRDPLNTFSGMNNYKLIFWALRFHGRIFFKALWVDVVRIWQPCDKVIMVRWSVRGMPRVPWEAQGHFDGTSEYKLDKDGKIYEHKVDNVVMNGNKPFKFSSVWDVVRFGTRTTASPTFFLPLHLFLKRISPYFILFTWVRFYCALAGTMVLKRNSQLSSGNCQ